MTRSEAIGKAKKAAKKMGCLVYVVQSNEKGHYYISCKAYVGTELYVTPDQSVREC